MEYCKCLKECKCLIFQIGECDFCEERKCEYCNFKEGINKMNVNDLTNELIKIGCYGTMIHNHIVRDFSYVKDHMICSWIMLPDDGDNVRFVEIHNANNEKPGVICHTIKCVASHMNGDWED